MKTFDKKSDKVAPPRKQRKFPVFVVIRHTRAGDVRIEVYDDRDGDKTPSYSRTQAMNHAEAVANQAAQDYGHGSASVFRGTLTLAAKAEQP